MHWCTSWSWSTLTICSSPKYARASFISEEYHPILVFDAIYQLFSVKCLQCKCLRWIKCCRSLKNKRVNKIYTISKKWKYNYINIFWTTLLYKFVEDSFNCHDLKISYRFIPIQSRKPSSRASWDQRNMVQGVPEEKSKKLFKSKFLLTFSLVVISLC